MSGCRLIGLWTIALFLLTQVAEAVHRAAVPHAVCLEHGERVHARLSADPERGETEATLADAGDAAPAEHAHCTLDCGQRNPVDLPPGAAVAARAPAIETPAPTVPIEAFALRSGRHLYLLAPKQGPPPPLG